MSDDPALPDDDDQSGYTMSCPFWIDTDAYSDEAQRFFCYGFEFSTILHQIRTDDGPFSTTFHRENESRVRMACGRFGRRCTIEACAADDDPNGTWSYLEIEAKS